MHLCDPVPSLDIDPLRTDLTGHFHWLLSTVVTFQTRLPTFLTDFLGGRGR